MSPEAAAHAMIGRHFAIVWDAIEDLPTRGDRAFFLLKLTDELSKLLGDEELAIKLVRNVHNV